MAELLRSGPGIFSPLADFLIGQTPDPRHAPLVTLLGKTMDERAIPILVKMLDSDEWELRRAAANALGWNRARAALESLDRLEGEDPDPHVRQEARAALDEILRELPGLASRLTHHRPLDREPDATTPASHDEVPRHGPDEEQRLKLIAAFPRLLALKYQAVPIHFSPGERLHMGVRMGSERRLVATLSALTGTHVQLQPWPLNRITQEIEKLYAMGDDDFCAFHERLTPLARDEVVEIVLSGVRPDEPGCPLDEVNDAVEAVQVFLSCCGSMRLADASVRHAPPEMSIQATTVEGQAVEIGPPLPHLRERFMAALRFAAMLKPGGGLGHQEGGRIRCTQCQLGFVAHVNDEKSLEHETLHLKIYRE